MVQTCKTLQTADLSLIKGEHKVALDAVVRNYKDIFFCRPKSMNQKQIALNVVEFQMRKFQILSLFPMQMAETPTK